MFGDVSLLTVVSILLFFETDSDMLDLGFESNEVGLVVKLEDFVIAVQ